MILAVAGVIFGETVPSGLRKSRCSLARRSSNRSRRRSIPSSVKRSKQERAGITLARMQALKPILTADDRLAIDQEASDRDPQ
jgi:hypothetical protein